MRVKAHQHGKIGLCSRLLEREKNAQKRFFFLFEKKEKWPTNFRRSPLPSAINGTVAANTIKTSRFHCAHHHQKSPHHHPKTKRKTRRSSSQANLDLLLLASLSLLPILFSSKDTVLVLEILIGFELTDQRKKLLKLSRYVFVVLLFFVVVDQQFLA